VLDFDNSAALAISEGSCDRAFKIVPFVQA